MVLPQGAAPGAGPNNPPPQGAAPGAGPNNPPPPGAVPGAGPKNPPQPGAAPGTGPNNPPQPGAPPGAGPNNPPPPGAVPRAGPNNPPPPGAVPGARPNNPPPPGAPPGAGPNNPPQPGAAPGAGPNNPPPPGAVPGARPNNPPPPGAAPGAGPNNPPPPGAVPGARPNNPPQPGAAPRAGPNNPPPSGAAPGAGPNNPPPPGAPPGAGPNIPPQQGAPQVATDSIQELHNSAKIWSIVSCICSVSVLLINTKKQNCFRALASSTVALIVYSFTAYYRWKVITALRKQKGNAPRNIWDTTKHVGTECLFWIPKLCSCVSGVAAILQPITLKNVLGNCEHFLKEVKTEASKCAAPIVDIDNAVRALIRYEGSVEDFKENWKLLSGTKKQLKSIIPHLKSFKEIEYEVQVCLNDLASLLWKSCSFDYMDFIIILERTTPVLKVKTYDEFEIKIDLLKKSRSKLKHLIKSKHLVTKPSFNLITEIQDYIPHKLKLSFPHHSKAKKFIELEKESKKCLKTALGSLKTSKNATSSFPNFQKTAANAVATLAGYVNDAEKKRLGPKLAEFCKATNIEIPGKSTRNKIQKYGNIVCVGIEIWPIWKTYTYWNSTNTNELCELYNV